MKKDTANIVAATVTGAVIGAGMVAAGAVALQDEKKRKKVKNIIKNVKKQAMSYMDDAKKETEHSKKVIEEKMDKKMLEAN